MKAITRDWLNFAEKDLLSCKKLLEEKSLTNIVAFHSQQTIEKCFKAILEENGIKVPKIHNLVRLFDMIENLVDFEIDEKFLTFTDEVYIETRYPGDLGMLPDGQPSHKEAKQLSDFAGYIYRKTMETLEVKD
ncbi:MAG: HEPN domain-containing protein [Bacteroidales bacterium]|nr:HEPN domain-containing protein [Bacteroidales bacterium]